MRPDRLIGNRLPNVVTVPSDPEDLSDRLTAAGLEAESADRILAFFSLHDGYGDPDNDMQALCDSTSGVRSSLCRGNVLFDRVDLNFKSFQIQRYRKPATRF